MGGNLPMENAAPLRDGVPHQEAVRQMLGSGHRSRRGVWTLKGGIMKVYVVVGGIDYESSDVLSVHSTEKLAYLAVEENKVKHKIMGIYPYDGYSVEEYTLDEN
jgi:hypothetical protein